MPCYQTITTSVELEIADKQALDEALKELGYERGYGNVYYSSSGQHTLEFRNGKLIVTSNFGVDETVLKNQIKKAYAGRIVVKATKKYGWKLKQDAKNKNKFVAQRRS